MPFIRFQGVKRDEFGSIIAGTASIIDVVYVSGNGKNHSKQKIRERLGMPLFIDADNKGGIFRSPDRGIVYYSCVMDGFERLSIDDKRLKDLVKNAEPKKHLAFGDFYLFLKFMKNIGMTGILSKVFRKEDDLQRCLDHLYHTQMRNGSKDRCDAFVETSLISVINDKVPTWSLRCDSEYFQMMGDDNFRLAFFQNFVNLMRRKHPKFGKSCYADSTPLPNEIEGNPFNAFSNHGTEGSMNQSRLVLIMDSETGLPVWFRVIPGNVTDKNTIDRITDDVKISLGIDVLDYVLDAGYTNRDLIAAYSCGESSDRNYRNDPIVVDRDGDRESWDPTDESDGGMKEKTIIMRMPDRRGYHMRTIFNHIKPLIVNSKYDFKRNGHLYFGKRKKVVLFGHRFYAYVFVDHNNALKGYMDYQDRHDDTYGDLKDKDKTWLKYKSGFFILLSNVEDTPSNILDRYFDRLEIEKLFKTTKDYLRLLPLAKWTSQRVMGKIMSDIISLIIFNCMNSTISKSKYTMTEIPTWTRSLICTVDGGTVNIDYPRKQVKDIYELLGISVPISLNIEELRKELM